MRKLLLLFLLLCELIYANNKLNKTELEIFKVIVRDDFYTSVDGGKAAFSKYLPKIILTNADKIQRDYEKNEIFADQKYKNKKIVVNGIVKKVRKDFMNNIIIDLEGGSNMFINPSVYINNNFIDWVAQININTNVYLVCEKSKVRATNVILSNCIPSYSWARLQADKLINNLNNINKKEFKQIKGIIQKIIPYLNKEGSCFKNKNHDKCLNEIMSVIKQIKKK
jgi:hypothetical protein